MSFHVHTTVVLPRHARHPNSRCVEVGCGSGYVTTSLALLLREAGIPAQHIAVDITAAAVAATTSTAHNHQVCVCTMRG